MSPGQTIDPLRASRIAHLQEDIQQKATGERRAWWEGYMRGKASFRGTTMADVRAALHAWHEAQGLHRAPPSDQAEIALALLREPMTEDKLAGTLFLQEILIPSGAPPCGDLLPAFATLFDEGYLADWNAVDWFCVKALGPLATRDGEKCARAIGAWRDASTLWQRRASAVAFVNLVKKKEEPFTGFRRMVLESCETLVTDPERFSQTGMGWVLREMSLADPEMVQGFLERNAALMSREAVKNATKHLPAQVARRLTLLRPRKAP